ncbi:SMEK domain-containing protein [Olivibacter sp. SA151]|uniref:SMEK domain-containing protein n=1 Tax=Olivibacter jilunii TaxID=985016 RepID=UPI003F14364C
MIKTYRLLSEIRSALAVFSHTVEQDNGSGYFDINKFAETLFKPVFSRIFEKKFSRFQKMNFPAIDLYSLDDEIAIQVTSERSLKKVRNTLDMFLEKGFHQKYRKLYIYFLKKNKLRKTSVDKIVSDQKYNQLVRNNVFNADSLLDSVNLSGLIGDCSPEIIEEIHSYLANEFSPTNIISAPPPIEIPQYAAVNNYIERHLTKSDQHDHWASYFGKKTLFKIIGDKVKNNLPIRIIIKAEAGQGKSIELDNIAYHIQNNDLDLYALRVTIKNYTADLYGFIGKKYRFWEKVTKSKVLLLVDGIDEINPAVYQNFVSEFNHLIDSDSGLNVICTIRSNFDSEIYTVSHENFDTYYLDRLSQSDVDHYVENQSNRSEQTKALTGKKWAKNIIYIPFYLTELVSVSNNDNEVLPNNLVDLYEKIIVQRLSQDNVKYNGSLNKRVVYDAMRKIAVFMTLKGENVINLSQVLQLTSLDRQQILTNPFLSTYDKDIETWVSSIHNNFQEYLTAKQLSTLPWPKIKKILFNTDNGFLNVKLLNTTALLFSIISRHDERHELLTEAVNKSDYTILFHFEKERIPLRDRLALFKRFILEGKQKKIAYLSGDFASYKLIGFIEGDMEGLDFVIQEIKNDIRSSNHFQSLLFFLHDYSARPLSKKRKQEIFETIESLITIKGFRETEYREMIDIIFSVGYFTEDTLNHTIKKCPLIHYRYVLTKVIDLIGEKRIPDQFEFVLQNAKNLYNNEGMSVSNYKRIFSKYILDTIDYKNYKLLFYHLSESGDPYLSYLLKENSYFEEENKMYLDRIYLKLAQLDNQAGDNRIMLDFINYLNEVQYDSYSHSTYGNAIEFFKHVEQENLLKRLLTSQPLLESGYLFNELFDLQAVDHSQTMIMLHKSGEINDDRLKMLYSITFSNLSVTTLNLCRYVCAKFPKEFAPFKTRISIDKRYALWREMDAKLLNNRTLFIESLNEIINYIKVDIPDLIMNGRIDLYSESIEELKGKFGCNVIADFLRWDCRNQSVHKIVGSIEQDKAWFIYLAKILTSHKYDEDMMTLLSPAKEFLQKYADSMISSINYKSFQEVEFDRDAIEIQIGLLFKEKIIELPFEKAMELLYFNQIEDCISSQERMDDFLINKYTLETVKQYVVEIIEDEFCKNSIKASAIRTCIAYKVVEPMEEVYELLESANFLSKEICFEYLKFSNFSRNRLLQYFVKHPTIYDSWHTDLIEYLLEENTTHSELIKIIESQVWFNPNIELHDYLPIAISLYGVRLGSLNCMDVFFKYVKSKKYYNSTLKYSYFEIIEKRYPNELFRLALECLEVYRRNIADHSGESMCGALDLIITNLASQNSERYQEAMRFYDRLIQDYGFEAPNTYALEWWKIRLTKRFQEKTSRYLTEREVLELI